jgi:virulence-associated protein VapD
MYAIRFDMDAETLQQAYPGDSWRIAYVDIRRILIEEEFAGNKAPCISEIRIESMR